MSEHQRTKTTILEMLQEKPYTLTQMAKELKLAKSTIFQHLIEMEANGMIVYPEIKFGKERYAWNIPMYKQAKYEMEHPYLQQSKSIDSKSSIMRRLYEAQV